MSVEHVIRDDYLQEDIKKQIYDFNQKLEDALDDANFQVDRDGNYTGMYLEDIECPDDTNSGMAWEGENDPSLEEYNDMVMEESPEDDEEEAIDKYLNVKLIMDVGTNNEWHGRVVKRLQGLEGEPIGHAHSNPLFDTCEYEVEFTDGTCKKYQANIIAENMFAQVDDEG
jgi:hypothetical protein